MTRKELRACYFLPLGSFEILRAQGARVIKKNRSFYLSAFTKREQSIDTQNKYQYGDTQLGRGLISSVEPQISIIR